MTPLLPVAALAASVLAAACGNATGELPSGRAFGPASPAAPASAPASPTTPSTASAFADPASAPVPTVGTATAAPARDARLPVFTRPPPVAFADPTEAAPFGDPDPAADTLLARLGHVALRELAGPLVAGRYADRYLDVDAAVLGLLASGEAEPFSAPRSVDCPEGGRLEATGGPVPGRPASGGETLLVTFDRCALDGATLTGRLERTALADGFRLGERETLELDYRALTLERGTGATTLTGTTRSSVARRPAVGCDAEDVERAVGHRIESASVVRDGETVHLVDADHAYVGERVHERAGTSGCRESVTLTFDDGVTVSGGPFGAARAVLYREGRIERDARGEREPPARATLGVVVDDGSSLSLDLLSDRDGTARADVLADGVAVSFTVGHRFAD